MTSPDRNPDQNPLVHALAHHMHLDTDPDDPNPPSDPPAGPPIDPGSTGAGLFAWLILTAALIFTVSIQWASAPAAVTPSASEVTPPGGLMLVAGRYGVGTANVGLDLTDELAHQLIDQLDTFAGSPEDQLRVAVVAGELRGPDAAVERLDALDAELGGPDAPPYAPQLRDDAAAVRALIVSQTAPADPDGLRERHGWFGELALAQGLPDESPARRPVLDKARRTLLVAVAGVGGFATLALIGFVLALVAVVLIATGKLRASYTPPTPGGSVYLEVFVLFILGFLTIGFVADAILQLTGVETSRVLIWLLLLVPFWARLRGAHAPNFKFAMGWHAGKGLFREIGAGVVGYIACIPIFLLGIGCTLLLGALMSYFQGPGDGPAAPPTHPIIDQIQAGDLWAILGVYALAAVWAPLVEESLFRGAFYHHLRGRLHPILAALMIGFVFAVIHPQGLIAVPALMSLGVTFCLLREWRGSLIAPVIAHAMHNGALMTGLILALS